MSKKLTLFLILFSFELAVIIPLGITLVPTRDLELVVAGSALRPAPESMRGKTVIPGTERFIG